MSARQRNSTTGALAVLFVSFYLLISSSLSAADPRGVERIALLKFKSSVSDPTGILRLWSPAAGDHCSWPFVSCDSRSRVISLNISFSCSKLGPSDSICADPRRRLAGTISSAIGDLSELTTLSLPFHGFYGEIPIEIWKLEKLVSINLSENLLNGTLPSIFPPNLRVLNLAGNSIGGEIPVSISSCAGMQILDLSRNRFYGNIPANLGNCTELRVLLLSSNSLDGSIPLEFGRLINLQVLDVSRNSLSGFIPAQLGSCIETSVLIISNPFDPVMKTDSVDEFNAFEGGIPENITMLPKLKVLWAPRAALEGQIPRKWGNCERLEMVNLGQNLLTGDLPTAFAKCGNLHYLNLSSNKLTGRVYSDIPVNCMDVFDVSENKLSGPIPYFAWRICSAPFDSSKNDLAVAYYKFFLNEARKKFSSVELEKVVYHNFGHNNFSGALMNLPISVENGGNQTIYAFIADHNDITGSLDAILLEKCGVFKGLVLNLQGNRISGGLTNGVCAKCRSLLVLNLSHNQIFGAIPENLGSLENLLTLDLSRNWLKGQIPASVNKLQNLKFLSLAKNNLTGSVPLGFDNLKSLEILDLSSNSLSGAIPSELSNMKNLTTLLLNSNNLSGNIPRNFAFRILNVSFNNLTGSLPTNSSGMSCDTSFQGNSSLQPCKPMSLSVPSSEFSQAYTDSPPVSPTGDNGGGFSSIEIASITSASAIVSVLLALIILYIYTRKCAPRPTRESSRRREVTPFVDIGVPITYESVVRSTGNFNASNCIGSGGFGATYKAEVAPGVLVAIKRLAVGRFQGVEQFQAEVKTLGRCRHPNLVTLVGYHLGDSEMFLIYNYLPGGNLERFIQERCKRPVDWRMLHNIALDVAQALAYLHDSCVPRILHRDVKPSNILLDNEYNNAYLSDFGLARLLGNSETHATTGVAGTFGYVAPEYAMTCRVSDKADVYSYGVVLLELISNKKALDPSFSPYGNGFNIVAWAHMLLQKGRAKEFFVEGLWDVAPHDDLVEILHLGIKCTVDSLSTRPTMKHVVRRLRELRPPSF